jgi:aryl-alcohol dehydrogenase-like predicted oxidoreductase
MRKVEIIKGIQSSVLGFGCSAVLGSVDAKKSRRAIDIAVDGGINHFDLARSYGYGEAERFVGNVLKNKRDKIVLASKFGIQANWKANFFRPLKPLFRFASDKMKGVAKTEVLKSIGSTKIGDHFHERILLNKIEMRASLEKSLKALGTDYLDYLFVHEPIESINNFEDIFEEAEILKKEGKIRAFGLAYMRIQTNLHKVYINDFDLLQFDNSPGSIGYEDMVKNRGSISNIIFSPLKGGSLEMKPEYKLKKVFNDFPNSVVLCSMFNEAHIKENIKLASY